MDILWPALGISAIVVVVLYAVVGVTTILVLRGMSRRWREAGESPESDVPYGPSDPGILSEKTHEEVPVG